MGERQSFIRKNNKKEADRGREKISKKKEGDRERVTHTKIVK